MELYEQIRQEKPEIVVGESTVREYVLDRQHAMGDLRTLLLRDRPTAKQALQQHIGKLTLTPIQGPDGPAHSVNGAICPFTGPKNVMALAVPMQETAIPLRPRKPN